MRTTSVSLLIHTLPFRLVGKPAAFSWLITGQVVDGITAWNDYIVCCDVTCFTVVFTLPSPTLLLTKGFRSVENV